MKLVRTACLLRPEVQKGELTDAIFAADFGDLIAGQAPEVYQEASVFFRNTHPAQQLRKVVTTVFERLTSKKESGACLRLSTGFGGGKTHTLMALYHLASNIDDTTRGTELLPAAGRPKQVAVAAIDASKFGATVCGRHGNLQTHSLWGEIAFQLGATEGHKRVKSVDDPETGPDAALVRKMLPSGPVLLLLDELVVYLAQLTERGQNALLSFVGQLMSEVGARRQAVLVVTDPSDQRAYIKQSQQLRSLSVKEKQEAEAAATLDDVLGRKMTDHDPIGKEAAQVIARRLFESVDRDAAEAVSSQYFDAYARIAEEHPGTLPREATSPDYARRIVDCYPFHPRLLDTAQERLGALQAFNKSRGTLRLFARILRDVWEQELELPLITAGDLDWRSQRIQADLLQRLNRDPFMAAVTADLERHAGELDDDFETDSHTRVASALLLESLPLTGSSGMDHAEVTLATLRPSEAGTEPAEALDRLLKACWHTYPNETGTRWQFRYEPNVNKLIEERAAQVEYEDAKAAVLSLAQDYFGGKTFSLNAWPASPKQVPDRAQMTLALCDSDDLAQRVCEYADDADAEKPLRRRFTNSLATVCPTAEQLGSAIAAARKKMAAEDLAKEKKDEKLVKQQLDKVLPDLQRNAGIETGRAFCRVLRPGGRFFTLDEKYMVSEEGALQKPRGQTNLKQFLDDNKLVYGPTDVLDLDLFLGRVVSGATPSVDHAGAFLASAIHERALSVGGLKLMMDEEIVRRSILRAVEKGKLVVRLANGSVFDDKGCVSGEGGARTRTANKLTSLKLEADVLVAPPNAECVKGWLHEDKPEDSRKLGVLGGGELPPPPYVPSIVESWESVVSLAADRPLKTLTLRAESADEGKSLAQLAQPLSAKRLEVDVGVSGKLKDGGTLNFSASGLKLSHPLKPLEEAAKLFRACADGAEYEARLLLDFGDEGRSGMADSLEQAKGKASDAIQVSATFGEPPS